MTPRAQCRLSLDVMTRPAAGLGKRFIPARAGNAAMLAAQAGRIAVHPRASGERAHLAHLPGGQSGSSPRERGTRMRLARAPVRQRFIPARAGNACTAPQLQSLSAVHPRASGERFSGGLSPDGRAGSSPRERGTPLAALHWATATRFIPARAGNAARSPCRPWFQPVHPRASGERRSSLRMICAYAGSSPRERGTLVAGVFVFFAHRFIPARAGNA